MTGVENKDKIFTDKDFDAVEVLMRQLMQTLTKLINTVAIQSPFFIGYDIERISKEDEKNCIVDGVKTLSVVPLTQKQQLHKVLNAWQDFYAPYTGSTMFVHRLPGFVTVLENQDEILANVIQVNTIKDKLADVVRRNRDKHQRHNFIHSVFPGIMTEQLYRKIQYKQDHVNNVWFNWASRPVPKTFTLDEAKDYIEKLKSKPPIDYSAADWASRLDRTINNIQSGRFISIQKLKEFRLLPTIEFNIVKDEIKSRSRHNATIPFLLLGQKKNKNPIYSELSSFNRTKRNDTAAFDTSNKEMLDSHLSLVGILA